MVSTFSIATGLEQFRSVIEIITLSATFHTKPHLVQFYSLLSKKTSNYTSKNSEDLDLYSKTQQHMQREQYPANTTSFAAAFV